VTLRLRAAFGPAGIQPASGAKFRTYSQSATFVNPDGSLGNIAAIGGIGNADLRPERSIEREGGFELGLWHDRFTLDFTAFRKFTQDAILDRDLGPSLGLSVIGAQSFNVGNVLNTGVEATFGGQVVASRLFTWNMQFGFASRRNRLVTLGRNIERFTVSGKFLPSANDDDALIAEGYPLFGRWGRPVLGFSDLNGDGIIARNEIRLDDSLVFIGPSEPKYDLSIHQDVGIWNDRIHVGADLQYVHGLTQYNSYAASMRFYSLANYDRSTPLTTQACLTAAQDLSDAYCYYETVNYLRFNNLSVVYTAPPNIARFLRAQSASFAVLANNLGLWTGYNGVDPATNTAEAAGNQYIGGATVPQPRSWTFRVRLTF
jgi:hypothetical protein